MLAELAGRINKLETRIKGSYKKAEKAGSVEIPASVYDDLDKIQKLRERAATSTITSNQEAIQALELAANGHNCPEARLLRRVIAFLAKKQK